MQHLSNVNVKYSFNPLCMEYKLSGFELLLV